MILKFFDFLLQYNLFYKELALEFQYTKERIRHFLLKKSDSYNRSIVSGVKTPSMASVAKGLSSKCSLSERRILKYLSKSISEKDLSVTLNDLVEFSNLAETNLGNFISYLNEDFSSGNDLSPFYQESLVFFSGLNLALRRELSQTLFNCKNGNENIEIIKIAISLSKLDKSDLATINKMVKALHSLNGSINE